LSHAPASRLVPSQVPPAIHQQLLGIGRVVAPAATAPLYAPLQQHEPYTGAKVARHQAYGPDPRHLLDVFSPEHAGAPAPVLVFLHGGAFTGGERRKPGSPFYDNIMLWAVKSAMVGVNMTYRLAPEHQWPAAQQDVGAALAWIHRHIAAFGGDPARIVLVGHSAGAAHVAQYLAHPRFHALAGGGVAGAVMLSGLFDTTTAEAGAPMRSYFGDDSALYSERSALPGLIASDVPLLLAYAELDPPDFHAQSEQAHAALRAAGRPSQLLKLLGHSHMSEVYAFNTPDNSLSGPLAAFVQSLR
jgi:triacylglycerol lipase